MFSIEPIKQLPDLVSETTPSGRWYTLPDGTKLPSMTTVLSAKPKQGIIDWREKVGEEEAKKVMRLASSKGTNLHELAERYLKNEKITASTVMPDSFELFKTIRPYLDKIEKIRCLETALWSKTLGMAGRTDCIAFIDDVLTVIDFKTSRSIKTEDMIEDYFIQCTGYAIMYSELYGEKVNKLKIIMAVHNGQPLIFDKSCTPYVKPLFERIKLYKEINSK